MHCGSTSKPGAMTWAMSDDCPPGKAHEIPLVMTSYWRIRGHLTEGQSWIEAVLTHTPSSDAMLRADLLNRAGVFCTMRNEHQKAIEIYEESVKLTADQPGV